MGGYQVFFTRPVSLVLLAIALLSFGVPLFQTYRETHKKKNSL